MEKLLSLQLLDRFCQNFKGCKSLDVKISKSQKSKMVDSQCLDNGKIAKIQTATV